MPKYTTEDIRNIAITGGPGSGKTTLIEALLHEVGAIVRAGRVEDGNTVTDYDDLAKYFKHSLDSALVHFEYHNHHVNLIDTPGGPDFLGKSISVLPAVETVAIVIDAAAGIETVTRRIMRIAQERKLPRLIIVNKIDNAQGLDGLMDALQQTFGNICRPINLPAEGGTKVVDCFQEAEGDSDLGDVATHHTATIDQVVEVDEELMAQYLEKGEISPEALEGPFKRAMREAHLVPVCFVSARNGVGLKELLHILADLCPNPLQGNPRTFMYDDAEHKSHELQPVPDASKPLVAHVFKVASDPYVGKLAVFRVHQGHVGHDIHPRVDDNKKPIRVAHVFKLMGKDHSEIDQIIPGDIGAVAKVEELHYNSVLHDGSIGEHLHLRPLALPKPMYGLAIVGKSKGSEAKLSDAMHKMLDEDPTLQIERVAATGETVMRGLGEQHLRAKIKLMKDRYGIDVDTHSPKVAYKETITSKAEGHHRHKKQTGGSGQFGEVFLRVEPVSADSEDLSGAVGGLVFEDATFGGSVPKQYMPAIEKGIRRVMQEGAIAGYPMHNIKVSVYDGKHHPVDSKEIAFMTAGRKAFIDAVQKAKPVLLEPFVRMEITVPANMIGDISSDLSGRRGRIQGTDMLPGNQAVVIAEAPLSEVSTYMSQLKSITGGSGTYTMEYSHDERTPPNVQDEVVKQFQPAAEED